MKAAWYWHRLRAMGPAEVGAHLRGKLRQLTDERTLPDGSGLSLEVQPPAPFPPLPSPAAAPRILVEALRRDVENIMAGRWNAFGHLKLEVDDPPRWQRDYLAGIELASDTPSFRLEHRRQPNGADIKVIWEPNRWQQLVRLAQAAWVLADTSTAATCQRWLANWTSRNPPYRGLNWTSALEPGLRLVQFVWIDALLTAANVPRTEWDERRREILPAHVRYVWRHRSFGSSANNHLLGELAGLVLAVVRWPALATLAAPVERLQREWEREVALQFAPDGGNREQALGYHLFSWEFCWQTRAALRSVGRTIAAETDARLRQAAEFYAQLKMGRWDYGDSDNGLVTPFFADETKAAEEWRSWFRDPASSPAIQFWWGTAGFGEPTARGAATSVRHQGATFAPERRVQEAAPLPKTRMDGRATASDRAGPRPSPENRAGESQRPEGCGWKVFPDSGYAVHESAGWRLRWDLSPLGYLATAAHGHLDALHLSLARHGVSFVVDPGTGAYYADPRLRTYLASWAAHNGPHLPEADFPQRRGIFLWGQPHPTPALTPTGSDGLEARLELPGAEMRRTVRALDAGAAWEVTDACQQPRKDGDGGFVVHWQFAPGARLETAGDRRYRATCEGVGLVIELTGGWTEIKALTVPEGQATRSGHRLADLGSAPLETVCSPAFRWLEAGPALWLTGMAGGTAGCCTRFRAGLTASMESTPGAPSP